MVALLVVLTVLGCIGVDLALRRRKEAAEARAVREPAALFPSLTTQELPGGLFVHSGHTWAKLDSYGGAMQGFMGSYLEKNVEAFQQMQKSLQDQSQRIYGDNSRASQELWSQFMNLQGPAMQSLMQAYMEQSQKMFAQFQDQMQSQARNMFAGFSFPGFPGQPQGKPEPDAK